jgi:prophage maintenance system killer protein
VFFAFSAFPRCFPGAWRVMTILLTINQARDSGLRLQARSDELADLMLRVAARRSDFAAVRDWFSTRLVPIE